MRRLSRLDKCSFIEWRLENERSIGEFLRMVLGLRFIVGEFEPQLQQPFPQHKFRSIQARYAEMNDSTKKEILVSDLAVLCRDGEELGEEDE